MVRAFGEIVSTEAGFDVTIAGEGPAESTDTLDIRVRYNSMIQAGMNATVNGKTYTITGLDVEERYRYMRLSLTRTVGV